MSVASTGQQRLPKVKLTIYHQETVFDEFKTEWNALLHRSAANNIFSTWEWQSTWWAAYQAGELWVIACHHDDGKLVALAPWFIEHNALGERVVRSIGCVDVTDYVDVIVEPGYTDIVFDALAAHLAQSRERFDRINLCNIPESSSTTDLLGSALQAYGFEVEIELQEVCPIIHLPADWESYLSMLDKKQRHEIRRKIRRAEGEAETSWYIVGQEHDLDAELEKFLSLMAASHQEKATFLTNPRNVDFFKRMVPLTFQCGWLQLSFLKINGDVAAAYLNFDYGSRILVYNSGLMPEPYGHLSAGIVLLAYNIRHAIETGHTIYDFLRGNEIYKYRMGGQDTRVFKLKAKAGDYVPLVGD
jgi:CelD/BcsL family acetyltransferase involved in cellulose biosynthesis